MGECGCGKTELVRYLCAWMRLPLLTLNVHGGTTEDDMDQATSEIVGRGKGGSYMFIREGDLN